MTPLVAPPAVALPRIPSPAPAGPVLPASRTLRVSEVGVITFGAEDFVIDTDRPTVGRVVCVVSGTRFAFRRVLGVDGSRLRLRGDALPFEDRWDGDVVGCVVPRAIDRLAALDPVAWTRGSWDLAMAAARGLQVRRSLTRRPLLALRTETLPTERWPDVRAFWARACGRELAATAQPHQHVIGLYDGAELIGANIYLAIGATAFSAFTLVDRRYRGIGGGSRMLAHAVREARERGFESMYVHIHARNLPSIAAYTRAGFVQRGWCEDEGDPLATAEEQMGVWERGL